MILPCSLLTTHEHALVLCVYPSRPDLNNIRPAGRMRLGLGFPLAREWNFVENVNNKVDFLEYYLSRFEHNTQHASET
jgi:hypothetical protein